MVGAEPKRSHSRPEKGAIAPISSIDSAVPKEKSSRPTCSSAETGLRKMPKLWRTPKPMASTRNPLHTAVQYEREVMAATCGPANVLASRLPVAIHRITSCRHKPRVAQHAHGAAVVGSISGGFGRQCVGCARAGAAPRARTLHLQAAAR